MALLVYIVLGGINPNWQPALHGPETSSRSIGLSPADAGRGGVASPVSEQLTNVRQLKLSGSQPSQSNQL